MMNARDIVIGYGPIGHTPTITLPADMPIGTIVALGDRVAGAWYERKEDGWHGPFNPKSMPAPFGSGR